MAEPRRLCEQTRQTVGQRLVIPLDFSRAAICAIGSTLVHGPGGVSCRSEARETSRTGPQDVQEYGGNVGYQSVSAGRAERRGAGRLAAVEVCAAVRRADDGLDGLIHNIFI